MVIETGEAARGPVGTDRFTRVLPVALVVLSAVFVAAFLCVALSRLGHPYELEWMGGAFADHVDRVLRGERIYVPPTTEFVPFLYTPLFFYVSAGLARIVGEGFVPLRLVSIAATLSTFALCYLLIRRLSGRRLPAFVACGLYAASYDLVGTWYDTSRADSLFLCLLLAGLCVLLLGRRWPSALAAGALLTLSYMSKQTALLLVPPFLVAAALRDVRRAAVFGAAFFVLWGASVLVMDWLHDGWFSFYTWTLPRRHEYIAGPLVAFWSTDLLPVYPTLLVAAWWVVQRFGRDVLVHGAWGLGLLLASVSSRMHLGGAENVLMPAYLSVSLLGGLALGQALDAGGRAARFALATLAAQLVLLAWGYRPWHYVPTEADRRAGDRVVALLAQANGPVMVPLHGYLAKLAGKPPSAHAMAVLDLRGAEPELWERIETDYWNHARDHGVELVVLDDNYREFLRLVEPGFAVDSLLSRDDSMFPVVGLRTRPQVVYRKVP